MKIDGLWVVIYQCISKWIYFLFKNGDESLISGSYIGIWAHIVGRTPNETNIFSVKYLMVELPYSTEPIEENVHPSYKKYKQFIFNF